MELEFKGTPGPWSYTTNPLETNGRNASIWRTHLIDGEIASTHIADVEDFYDALLIAAAHDLLDIAMKLSPISEEARKVVDKALGVIDPDAGITDVQFEEAPAPELFYMQDSRQHVGNSMLWWAKGGGYTTEIEKAHVFTRKDVLRDKWRSTDVLWRKEYIDSKIVSTIDMQKVSPAFQVRKEPAADL